MLDAFHAMNVVMQKDPHASDGEALLLKYTAEERTDLCSRISHLFQGRSYILSRSSSLIVLVLASSLKLEFPLNDALPSTSNARDRLLAKIFHYRKNSANGSEEDGVIVAKDEDYELLYA